MFSVYYLNLGFSDQSPQANPVKQDYS